jgi:hypothetical protein
VLVVGHLLVIVEDVRCLRVLSASFHFDGGISVWITMF